MKSTYKRPVTVWEVYNRARTGQKVDEKEWDFKKIPRNATDLKKKYEIEFEKGEFIPTDEDLMDRLFQAGFELLVETGIYCIDTKRVIKYTEEEVWASVMHSPKDVTLGEDRDAVKLQARDPLDQFPPVIQGGPTGAPVSEDIFIQMHQSYAQEEIVDTIVDGILSTVEGHDPIPGSPWEIKGAKLEAMYIRAACSKAGRPGMAI